MSLSLLQLWLPIFVAGALCWIASAVFHMVVKHHNADYKQLPNEEEVGEVLGKKSLKPGLYHMPHCADMKEMANEEMQAKFNKGPIAMVSVFPNGLPPMAKLLSQQLLYFIFTCLLIAYAASLTLAIGSSFNEVFRLVMTLGFMAFGLGNIPYSIWYGHPWSNCLRFMIDALVYGAIVAAVFAYFWPEVL